MLLFADRDSPQRQAPLVGIARLAAQSPVLEAKSRAEYRDLPTGRWLNRCSGARVPFQWTINPYRGCEFACRYCFARYTHEFMNLSPGDDFERRIFAKQWDRAEFVRELARIPAGAGVGIGTATDPYQPAERRYGLTRRVLEALGRDSGLRIYLITKSDLIARDADVLAAVARRHRLTVHVTITTLDAGLARLLEPMAPRPDLRLAALRRLAEVGIATGVAVSPVLPGLTDSPASLEALARAAREAGAKFFGGGVVFLKPSSRDVFLPFLDEKFPGLAPHYRRQFQTEPFLRGAYPKRIEAAMDALRERYGLLSRAGMLLGSPPQAQLALFPDSI